MATTATNATQASSGTTNYADQLTYDGFLKTAEQWGLLDQFSAADRATAMQYPEFGYSLLTAKKNYADATTDEGRMLANAQANDLRETYGNYTGGPDGGDYSVTDASPTSYKTQNYYNAQSALNNYQNGAYDNEWTDISDNAAKNYLNMNYTDWTGSDAYKALADRYTQKGQQAMNDTLGTVSARTGGLASTYATQAGQQTYDQYMDALEEAAQTAYQNERSDAYNNYNVASNQDNTYYNRYQDDQSKNLNLYNAYSNEFSNDYQRWSDENALNTAAEETAYERQQDAYSKLATLISSYGYEPTAADLEAADMSESVANTLLAAYKKSQTSNSTNGGNGVSYTAYNADDVSSHANTVYNALTSGYGSGYYNNQTLASRIYSYYDKGYISANEGAIIYNNIVKPTTQAEVMTAATVRDEE